MGESAPVAVLPEGAERTLTGETYGALKAECEQLVQEHFGEDCLLIRPGLIVGPHDPTDRFTYWPVRINRPGPILIPAARNHPIQWIDVRDLARWTLHLAQERTSGVFNATGPEVASTLGEFLLRCQRLLAPNSELVAVDDLFLQEQQVGAFVELPFWLPEPMRGLLQVDCRRAREQGLTSRPLEETVRDTLVWHHGLSDHPPLRAGLSPSREAELIALWRAKHSPNPA
jgi:2'-hydroxyisoflavone reductase